MFNYWFQAWMLFLNSLSEEKLQSSIDLLATNGRFLEIGKFDLSNNSNMGENEVAL